MSARQLIENSSADLLGDCRDEELIDSLFGSVSEFARLAEENGDEFTSGSLRVTYNSRLDRHYFWRI